MMLANVGVFSLQAAVVILVGLLLPRVLRVARPLMFLQGVLGVVILLPLLQNWERPVIVAARVAAGRIVLPASALERVDGRAPVDWALFGMAVLGLGVLVRTCWLLAGLARLRDLRTYAEPAGDGLAVSHEIEGPVTFGFWRPVILVPAAVMTMPEETRAAILAHERAHIRRRDWLFVLLEEVVLCGLWFHPAVWLLVSQIRLEREKVVDAEACRETGSRETYVGALLAVAGARSEPGFAPPFLRRRELAARIQSLIEEVPMTGLRRVVSYILLVLATAGAGVTVTRLFPLRGQPQVVAPAPENITVEGAELVFHTRPRYPISARLAGVTGPVTLALTLAANGEVDDARVVSGAQELRKAALDAVLQWQFKPGGGAARVTIEFRAEPIPAGTGVTKFFIDEKMPPDMAAALRARLKPYEGRPYTDEIHVVAQSVSRTLKIRAEQTVSGGQNETTVFIRPSLAEATAPGRVRMNGAVQAVNLIYKPEPVYPPLARQARIQGSVRFHVVIDKSGGISSIEVVSGHPLLIPAALEAVKQYRYQVTSVNGQPAEVSRQVDVTFSL
jgi:TonB family protein